MKHRLIVLGIFSLIVNSISGMVGLYGKKPPFTKEELQNISVFDPLSCKKVSAFELIGKRAYKEFDSINLHDDGWVDVSEKHELERGNVVMLRRPDKSAAWAIIYNKKSVYLNRKDLAKPIIVEGIPEQEYPCQDLQGILVDLQIADGVVMNVPHTYLKEFKISVGTIY